MKKIFIFLSLFINLLLVYQLVFSEKNIFLYTKLKKEYNQLEDREKKVERENILLSREIKRLREDEKYLELVIRKGLNYVKPGEVLYLFKD
ncbi:MAG: Septum formation initiator [Desulfonauticus sp. 38_4375]|nr:MAG: Septum formation initiator [Desulfonauticus sp. 38_4375]